jgi:hypothetical protein
VGAVCVRACVWGGLCFDVLVFADGPLSPIRTPAHALTVGSRFGLPGAVEVNEHSPTYGAEGRPVLPPPSGPSARTGGTSGAPVHAATAGLPFASPAHVLLSDGGAPEAAGPGAAEGSSKGADADPGQADWPVTGGGAVLASAPSSPASRPDGALLGDPHYGPS